MGYQSIYNRLRSSGLTQEGALAMLGNWDCESNCESVRVQGDFNPFRTVSKQYVADVDSGKISRETFQKDAKGFGLAQWTFFTRKAALYDFAKMQQKSIGNENMQVDFALLELKSDFPGLLEELKTCNDLYRCTRDICYKFENPAVKNVDARFNAANRIKGEIDLTSSYAATPPANTAVPTPTAPTPTPAPVAEHWPPRTIDKNMNGYDVMVLQAVLKARGYPVTVVDGDFGSYLEEQVKKFQQANGLTIDGVVGPMTWGKLLERG